MTKEELEKELEQKNAEVEQLTAALETLNAKLSEYESTPSKRSAKPTIKIGKAKYQVEIPSIQLVDGTVVTVQDLKENKLTVGNDKICEYLLKINSGMLKPVE